MKIEDLEICLTDNSVKEYGAELLENLNSLYNDFDTHSMNQYGLVLKGQKEMLGWIITYIERTL